MGNVNKGNDLGKQIGEWVDKNMTKTTSEKLANSLYNIINTVFSAPFDIAMGLVDIIQNRKYSKYIVTIWSVIGASVLLASLILTIIDGAFPFNAWGLGIAIASAVVIWIYKHPITINVTSELSKEIEREICRMEECIPTISEDIHNDQSNDEELSDELLDDGELSDELLDDDELSDELDAVLIDNQDDIDNLNMDVDFEDILNTINNLPADTDDGFDIDDTINDILNNQNIKF